MNCTMLSPPDVPDRGVAWASVSFAAAQCILLVHPGRVVSGPDAHAVEVSLPCPLVGVVNFQPEEPQSPDFFIGTVL